MVNQPTDNNESQELTLYVGRKSQQPDEEAEWYLRTLVQQDALVRRVVETAAAIHEYGGESFDFQLLDIVLQESCEHAVSVAAQCKLLDCSDRSTICFPNSLFQETVYGSIPKEKRSSLHLKIGRRVWKSGFATDVDDLGKLCLIANQLNPCRHTLTDPRELEVIATINLRAGKRAIRSSDFVAAASYFNHGISALGVHAWSTSGYETVLDLHNCGAEANYCTGDFGRMESILDAVFEHATSFDDKLQAYHTLVMSNGSRQRLAAAIRIALDVLRELGEPLPAKPGAFQLALECAKTKWMLRGKSDRFFLTLKTASDSRKVAAMQMLNLIFMYGYTAQPQIAVLSALRMLRLVVDHGLSSPASTAFSGYGTLLCLLFGQTQEGFRYGQLALAMLDKFDAQAWLPRIYVIVHGLINIWVRPLRESLEPLKLALSSAMRTGDMEGYSIAAIYHLFFSFYTGASLGDLVDLARSYCEAMDSRGQTIGLLFLVPFLEFLCELSGITFPFPQLRCIVPDGQAAHSLATKEGNKVAMGQCFTNRATVHCLFGKYDESLEAAQKSHETASDANFGLIFYEGLASLAAARTATAARRRKHVVRGKKAIRQMATWSRRCPSTFRNKLALLEAELATLQGKAVDAFSSFNASIMAAKEESFVQDEGLAYKRLALYHCFLGNHVTAAPYLALARGCYVQWGSVPLTKQVELQLGNTTPTREKSCKVQIVQS